MLFTTRSSPLLGPAEDQGEDNTELLTLGSNEDRASTPLEKPRRGRMPRKISQSFRFSRQDSPAILVSDFGSEEGRRNGTMLLIKQVYWQALADLGLYRL